MNDKYRIFAINIGSTSTKIAMFENMEKVFEGKAEHDAAELKACGSVTNQKEIRLKGIEAILKEAGLTLDGIDAVSARCGGTGPIEGGTYEINRVLVDRLSDNSVPHHNADLGGILGDFIREKYGCRAFFVDSPETDEFIEVARITGMKGINRISSTHTLNQKAVCRFYAESIGKKYEDLNLVVAHIGGGVSVSSHRKGKIIDSTNIIKGDGPMAPTRSGQMPAFAICDMAFSGKYTRKELEDRINMTGGLQDHLGTVDVLEIKNRIAGGDEYARLIYDAFIYQIGKNIGMYSAVLEGDVDAILLTGGISKDEYLVSKLRKMCGYIAEVNVIAGEFEMEALAAGAYRVLCGQEEAKEYIEP
ncbi:MAG: butyrate kinase [Parasporobacterium sp.]|nr:butyrate kinase [Parasporobacterium sp.]